ncbi:MAG: helix-turn-helix domain-containing protein [Zoogloeaceae bacterium]|jgi:IclR family pca regulon transcriptional regulator|nr:helix-turn-helix domain-containing protein [Zoogloeaceae bacterium]
MDDEKDFVRALEKGLVVIKSFDFEHQRQTLSDVAKRTRMTRAAARRYLLTLTKLGYAESDGKFFWLAPRILHLGYALFSSTPLSRLAQPILDRIGDSVGEIASLAVRDGSEVIFLAHSTTSNRIISTKVNIGMRIPLFCSAAGKAILAYQSSDEIKHFLKSGKFPKLTPHTITGSEAITRELTTIRDKGYGTSIEELELGLLSIGVPLPESNGRIMHALTVSLHAGRMDVKQLVEKALPPLLAGQQELAAML